MAAGDPPSLISPSDIVIAVVGSTGSGKSTFISKCTGQEVEVEHGLCPCTTVVEPFTFQRHGRTVHLIDTPGFHGTTSADALLLEDIAACLNQAYISGAQIHGIIYLHPINSTRVQGSTMKSLHVVQRICGQDALSLILLGSTMWDKEDYDVAEERENELTANENFWGSMVKNGGKTFRFHNDQESALIACDYIIERRRKMTLALQHQMVNERKPLNETDAGLELERDIIELKQACKSRVDEAREEALRAARMNNDQLTIALNITQVELQAQLDASERALHSIHGNMEELHVRSETALREELERLRTAQRQDDILLSERMDELESLEQRLSDLAEQIDEMENRYAAGHSWRAPSMSSDSAIPHTHVGPPVIATAGSWVQPREVVEQVKPVREEAQRVSEKYEACQEAVRTVQARQAVRRHRIDSCMTRLGAGAGVVGAAFQVAAFAATMAACTVM